MHMQVRTPASANNVQLDTKAALRPLNTTQCTKRHRCYPHPEPLTSNEDVSSDGTVINPCTHPINMYLPMGQPTRAIIQ